MAAKELKELRREPRTEPRKPTRSMVSMRLRSGVKRKLDDMAREMGWTLTQVVEAAIEQLADKVLANGRDPLEVLASELESLTGRLRAEVRRRAAA